MYRPDQLCRNRIANKAHKGIHEIHVLQISTYNYVQFMHTGMKHIQHCKFNRNISAPLYYMHTSMKMYWACV